jgi:hypothetical protein
MSIYPVDNGDVEHDAEHFADTYRDAVAAIDAMRPTGGGDALKAITNHVACGACFVEALGYIAARLGSHAETVNAARAALTEHYDDTGVTPPDFTLPDAG